MIEGVLFDMDGLLFDTEREAVRLSRETALSLGWDIPDSVFISCIGLTSRGTREVLSRECGADFPFDAVHEGWARGLKDLSSRGDLPQKEGADALIRSLYDRGIPLVLATSSPSAMAEANLDSAGWRSMFCGIVGGDMVSRGKPDPEVFLRAAVSAGIEPGRCLVLEDSEPGILAAHRAGCRPVMVPDMKAPNPEIRSLAFEVVESLGDVLLNWEKLSS